MFPSSPPMPFISTHDVRERDRCRHPPDQPFEDHFAKLARDRVNDAYFGAATGFERSLCDEFGWPPAYLTSYIMLPSCAYLAKGARFIPKPYLKYRIHSENPSFSLRAEAASGADRLIAEGHTQFLRLAHSILTQMELDRLGELDHARVGAIVHAIRPLVYDQIGERARKLVRARIERIELRELGISRLSAPCPDACDRHEAYPMPATAESFPHLNSRGRRKPAATDFTKPLSYPP